MNRKDTHFNLMIIYIQYNSSNFIWNFYYYFIILCMYKNYNATNTRKVTTFTKKNIENT